MTYVYPDFYPGFRCTASLCRHSCCRGWEIDIDPESMARYSKVSGETGQMLKECISSEPTPHFILTEDEVCPFLRDDGLCRLIVDLGEESLCDICAQHPRFYNEYPGRLEIGLGLCCEEAARLLTQGNEPLRLIEETDDGEPLSALTPQLEMRGKIFEILGDEGEPLTEKMEKAMAFAGGRLMDFDASAVAEFFETLECMDSEWRVLLDRLSENSDSLSFEALNCTRYERIAEYFVFRHFAVGETGRECALRLQFAFLSTRLICCLDSLGAQDDALRMYSDEIEYSDENVGAVLEYVSPLTYPSA